MNRLILVGVALILAGCQTTERRAIQIESRTDAYCVGRGNEPGSPAYNACYNGASQHFVGVVDAKSEDEYRKGLQAVATVQ